MIKEGHLVDNFFTKEKLLYQDVSPIYMLFILPKAAEEGEKPQT
jgi:hypothetical protein